MLTCMILVRIFLPLMMMVTNVMLKMTSSIALPYSARIRSRLLSHCDIAEPTELMAEMLPPPTPTNSSSKNVYEIDVPTPSVHTFADDDLDLPPPPTPTNFLPPPPTPTNFLPPPPTPTNYLKKEIFSETEFQPAPDSEEDVSEVDEPEPQYWSEEMAHEGDEDLFNDLLDAIYELDIKDLQYCLNELTATNRHRIVNTTDADSFTLLMIAATMDDPKGMDMVNILLEAKADVNYTANDGSTALDCCVQDNLTPTIDLMLVQPDIDVNSGRCSSLFLAAQNGNGETVAKLLEAKARVDRRNFNGLTPLLVSIIKNFPDVVQQLLEAKAQSNFPNASLNGFTPLIAAMTRKNLEVTKLLLDANADPEQAVTVLSGEGSRKMMTVEYPIMYAARYARVRVGMCARVRVYVLRAGRGGALSHTCMY